MSVTLARLNIPSTLVIGGGAARQVGAEARRLRLQRPLVVTDPFLSKSGLAQRVLDGLAAEGLPGELFADVQPDPTLANVAAGLEVLRRAECDGVIAIGGGSSIDCAKAIAVMSRNAGAIGDYVGYHKIPLPGLPLLAIPTTAGTGSEVTRVTVITDSERQVKMMVLDAHLLPTVALVDYELTLTMPPGLTAAVGVDSLTHALEAYVSQKANPLTDLVALEAGRLIAANLRTAFHEAGHRPAREAMMRGATLAGIAFSNASVALVHGMSRPIGAYFHVPHGLSNAMLLPAVTAFSVDAAPERYAHFARHVGLSAFRDNEDACRDLVAALEHLNRDLQVPSPRAYGIERERYESAIPQMAQDALASGSPGFNPRVPTADEIMTIYRQCYG
jgi:alcohol dehydrogenase class IV